MSGRPKGALITANRIRAETKKKTEARFLELVSRGSREPFRESLATALAGAPTRKDWRELAKRSPNLWATAVNNLAESAGYQKQSVSVDVRVDAVAVARELVARHGRDRAEAMLEAAGFPTSLLPEPALSESDSPDPVTIEHESTQVTDSS